MAQKRINTKFVIALGGVVVGLMLLVLLAKKLRHERPDKYLEAGRKFVADGKYDEAVKNLRHAIALDPRNADIWTEYGDGLNNLSALDVEFLKRARDAWERALAVDPTNKVALSRL